MVDRPADPHHPHPRRERRVVNGDALWLCAEFAAAEPLGDAWEPELYRRFKEALRAGMAVLDVGASFGLYAMAAARGVGPSGCVYAFEPARRTAAALRRHLGWNGVAERVEVVEAAAGARTGRARFWEQETSFLASLVEASARREESRFAEPVRARRVPVVALDDFCRARGVDPDIVKVDVEGAEGDVLRGAGALLARRRAALFVELHDGVGADGSADAVLGELRAAGWACEQLGAEAATRHYACTPLKAT